MEKYFLMAIERDNSENYIISKISYKKLNKHYNPDSVRFFIILLDLNQNDFLFKN